MVGRVVGNDWACWEQRVPRGWVRDRDYCGERAEEKNRDQSRLRAAGAVEGSPPPPHPLHLKKEVEEKKGLIKNSKVYRFLYDMWHEG